MSVVQLAIEGWKKCYATTCHPFEHVGISKLVCSAELLCAELPYTHGGSSLILQAEAKHLQIMSLLFALSLVLGCESAIFSL